MANAANTSNSGIKAKTLTGTGNVIKLLPTGTVFIFQFLSPVLTNNGHCTRVHKILSSILLGICGFSCLFSSFTDSYTINGKSHYGISTLTGLWPSSSEVDSSKYKLKFIDLVHAFLSLVVFAVLSLLDGNIVKCFYPSFESTGKLLLMALPPAIGTISGFIFAIFPNTRHGIGYPPSTTEATTTTTTYTAQEGSGQRSSDAKITEGSQV